MGVPIYLLRITPQQAELDGDSLLRLLSRSRAVVPGKLADDRLLEMDTVWMWLDPLLRVEADIPEEDLQWGRVVEPSEGGAPVLVADPGDVVVVGRYLASVSFDQLWARNGEAVEAAYRGVLDEAVRADLRSYLSALRKYYAAAVRDGDAIMMWAPV